MECPDCGLPILIKDGTITPHLRPDTLKQCTGAPKAATHEQHEDTKPAEKKPAAKAPDKAAIPNKTKSHK